MPSMTQRILDVLAESPLPMTTPDIQAIVAAEMTHARARVHVALRSLYHGGLVVCQKGRTAASGVRNWTGKPRTGHPVTRWKLA